MGLVYYLTDKKEYVIGEEGEKHDFYISLIPKKRILKIPYKKHKEKLEVLVDKAVDAVNAECKKIYETPESLIEKCQSIYELLDKVNVRALNTSFATFQQEKNALAFYGFLTAIGVTTAFYPILSKSKMDLAVEAIMFLAGMFVFGIGSAALTFILSNILSKSARETKKEIKKILEEKNLKAKPLSYNAPLAELILKY